MVQRKRLNIKLFARSCGGVTVTGMILTAGALQPKSSMQCPCSELQWCSRDALKQTGTKSKPPNIFDTRHLLKNQVQVTEEKIKFVILHPKDVPKNSTGPTHSAQMTQQCAIFSSSAHMRLRISRHSSLGPSILGRLPVAPVGTTGTVLYCMRKEARTFLGHHVTQRRKLLTATDGGTSTHGP